MYHFYRVFRDTEREYSTVYPPCEVRENDFAIRAWRTRFGCQIKFQKN